MSGDLIARGRDLQTRVTHAEAEAWIGEILEELKELTAWQEKVCAIIQPAETADEWGADVADIIAWREEQRKAALAVVDAARKIHDRNVTGFRVSTGIIDALALFDRALAAREVER